MRGRWYLTGPIIAILGGLTVWVGALLPWATTSVDQDDLRRAMETTPEGALAVADVIDASLTWVEGVDAAAWMLVFTTTAIVLAAVLLRRDQRAVALVVAGLGAVVGVVAFVTKVDPQELALVIEMDADVVGGSGVWAGMPVRDSVIVESGPGDGRARERRRADRARRPARGGAPVPRPAGRSILRPVEPDAPPRDGVMRTHTFQVDTGGRRVVDLSAEVAAFAARSGGDGLVHVFVPHATAGVALMETGSGSEVDLQEALDRLLPRDDRYAHRHGSGSHGGDHLLPVFVSPSLTVPVLGGVPALGTWQSVVLVDPNRDNDVRTVRLSFVQG